MGRREELTTEAQRAFDAFVRLGLSEEGAFAAAVGRDGARSAVRDPFDRMVETFREFGLSEEGARSAAVGRARSEHEAREALTQPDLEAVAKAADVLTRGGTKAADALRVALVTAFETAGCSADEAVRRTGQEMRAAEDGRPSSREMAVLVEAARRHDTKPVAGPQRSAQQPRSKFVEKIISDDLRRFEAPGRR